MVTRRTFASLWFGVGLMGLLGLCGCKHGSGVLDSSRILAVRLTSGGGMTGGGESSELRREGDGTIVLSTRSKEWHYSRETGMDYVLDESAFERMAQIANEYELAEAATRKDQPYQAQDAPTRHLTFEVMDEGGMYDPDASFTISDEQDLTERDWDGWRAVTDALAELAAGGVGTPYLEPVQLTIVCAGAQYHFALNESTAAQDLAECCPLDVTAEDRDGKAKAFRLDEPLDVGDAPVASCVAGSICYDAQRGEVLVLCADDEPADGLYELGFVEDTFDIQYLADIEAGNVSVWCSASFE